MESAFGQLTVLGGKKRALAGGGGVAIVNPVILVTDYGSDCDDAAAIDVLIAYHNAGTITLIGAVADWNTDASAPGLRAHLDERGLTAVPVYARGAATPGAAEAGVQFAEEIRDRFGVPGQSRTAYVDATVGIRTLLAAHSGVHIISLGPMIVLSALLNSAADSISPMSGAALVAAKVTKLYQMAGDNPSRASEANILADAAAATNVADNWPTVVDWLGFALGDGVRTGPSLLGDPLSDPTVYAFDVFRSGTDRRRASYDPATALAMCETIAGTNVIFGRTARGTQTIVANGNSFDAATAGNDAYLTNVVAAAPAAILGNEINKKIASVELNPFVQPPTNGFFCGLTEGSGIYCADDTEASFRAFLGGSRVTSGRSTTRDPAWAALGSGHYLDFDGTNDTITVPQNGNFEAAGFVFCVLFNPDSLTGVRALMTQSYAPSTGLTGFRLTINNSSNVNFKGFSLTAQVANLDAVGAASIGTWTIITGKIVGNQLTLYKNGSSTPVNSATLGTAIDRTVFADNPIVIGAIRAGQDGAFNSFFDGKMGGFGHCPGGEAERVAMLAKAQARATAMGVTLG